MLLLILSIVILLIIIYLLFVPIVLYINTKTNQYFIQIKGLAKANIEADELEVIKVHLKVMFFNFDFYPLKKVNFSGKTKNKKKTTKKRSSKTISLRKIINVLGTFRVKQFQAEIDSGDCIFNSKLYPVFALLNFYNNTQLSANFEGKNNVLLSVENRPLRLIKSFINN